MEEVVDVVDTEGGCTGCWGRVVDIGDWGVEVEVGLFGSVDNLGDWLADIVGWRRVSYRICGAKNM